MSKVFLHLLNISITAGWIVLVVVLLRFVLKKAPKWVRVVLWGLVALRLLLPVSIESVTSLVPSAETVKVESVTAPVLTSVNEHNGVSYFYKNVRGEQIVLQSGFPTLNSAVNPTPEEAAEHFDTVAVLKTVAGLVWLIGVVGMLLYALISFLRLCHRVRASVKLEKGVYVCDEIKDPFILGLILPKIYLPSGMDEQTRAYVLSHERAHLKRFDHIWKPLGFLLLSVYWFNPLLWLAYILLCRDIELACDEKVVKELDDTGKAAYSEALVTASVSRRMVSACPLAFGETGVKSRVKSVLNYKKPAFWIILVAILACIAVAVCFLTMPKKDKAPETAQSDTEPESTPLSTYTPEVVNVSTVKVLQWLDYFYSSDMPWDGTKEITHDAFPNVTFRWTAGSVEAVESGKTRTLFSGMPVWSVYFADLTGDGKPELIATVSFGSGIVDEHIIVYDYANKQSYTLWDRMQFDFHLYTVDGALYVGKTPYMGDKQVDYGTLMMHDGVLSCRWQSDGSYIPLLPELHESELIGEWLVEEETDNDGNVLYSNDLTLWKEYNFREDGTVVYNETVPISSDYEKAFGHPVEYPYEVHNDYVYIAGDDTSGAFRFGQYDRETRMLTLMYNTDAGTVYAKLRRLGEETSVAESTYLGEWELAKFNQGWLEYGPEGLAEIGLKSATLILNEGGTGSCVYEAIDGSTEVDPFTYTADENELKLAFSYDNTYITLNSNKDFVYDPQKDTLTFIGGSSYWVYVRKGSSALSLEPTLTVDRIVGVWRTEGISFGEGMPSMLAGTLAFYEDGAAKLQLSGNYGSDMNADYNYTLDSNTIRFAPGGEIGTFVVYDPNTDTLSFPIMNIGVLTFTRTDEPLPAQNVPAPVSETLDEATLCTIWQLVEIEAPDGSNGDPKGIMIEQFLDFRTDGTVHFIERNGENYSQATLPYSYTDDSVTVGETRRLVYDPTDQTLSVYDPNADDIAVWIFARTPNVKLPIKEAALDGTWIVDSIDLDGTDVTNDAAYQEYRDLKIELYRSGKAVIYGADERWSGNGFTWVANDEDGISDLAVTVRNTATGVSCDFAVNDYEFSDGMLSVFADFLFADADPDLYMVLKRDPVTPLPSETVFIYP